MSGSKTPGPLARVWRALESVAQRLNQRQELSAFYARRISTLEDRIAAIDGGDDTASASRAALRDMNAERKQQGNPSLSFRFKNSTGGEIEWTGDLARKIKI